MRGRGASAHFDADLDGFNDFRFGGACGCCLLDVPFAQPGDVADRGEGRRARIISTNPKLPKLSDPDCHRYRRSPSKVVSLH